MADKALFHYFGQGVRDNVSFVISTDASVTLHFKESGTNTDSDKYFNLGQFAKVVRIVNNKIATITHINGVELQSPITLGTANANAWTRGIEWGSVTVRADQDSTSFEVYAS